MLRSYPERFHLVNPLQDFFVICRNYDSFIYGQALSVSQALTLFTTPVIYLYLDQFSHWVSSWRKTVPEKKLQATSEPVLRPN